MWREKLHIFLISKIIYLFHNYLLITEMFSLIFVINSYISEL